MGCEARGSWEMAGGMSETSEQTQTARGKPLWSRLAGWGGRPMAAGLDRLRGRPRLQQVLRGSAWSVVGFGAEQALRLAGNVAMAWLLFPEALGLMALVMVVVKGLQWITETGVHVSVMQDSRGHEAGFLHTAWTIRLIRGVGLWVLTAALAWPAAAVYDEPALLTLMPVVGLTVLFQSATSPATFTLARDVQLGPLTTLRVGAQGLSLAVAVGLAWVWPSVWVLAIRALLQNFFRGAGSYLLPGDWPRPRLQLERDATGRIYRFGRWLLISSAIGFFVHQGDRAVLGAVMTASELGVYSIASMLALSLWQATAAIRRRALLPVYARLNEEGLERLRPRLWRARLGLMGMSIPACCFAAIFGPEIIGLLYDDRYAAAGWVLQALSTGMVGALVGASFGGVPEALGDSFRLMVMNVIRGANLVLLMIVGGWLGGRDGLILGIAAAYFLQYVPVAWIARAHGLWTPRLDLAVIFGASGVIALGLWVRHALAAAGG